MDLQKRLKTIFRGHLKAKLTVSSSWCPQWKDIRKRLHPIKTPTFAMLLRDMRVFQNFRFFFIQRNLIVRNIYEVLEPQRLRRKDKTESILSER